jgi:Protein of unknown function (DUF2891)
MLASLRPRPVLSDPSGRRPRALSTALVFLALLLFPAQPITAQEPEPESETDRIFREFREDRTELYNTLAPPFVDCFKRRDSAIDPLSPIFHGCLDWHSAVHAAYSHHALYRHTGAGTYLDLVEQQIAPQGVSLIAAEQVYEQAKGADLPLTENPYGFGWFLILARERELSTGKTDFRPMANYAANEMVKWFQARATNNDARSFILNTAHANYSWSLMNLDVWARYTNDATLLAAVREASKPLLQNFSCPATRDQNVTTPVGFQPACLMRLAAAAHIWGDHVKDWVAARLPADFHIDPITELTSDECHQGGLNFTRSFALYQLYQLTGNTDLRDNYVELVRYHVGRPDLYIDPDYLGDPGYMCYSHWVAQLGVRSISESFEALPATPDVAPSI